MLRSVEDPALPPIPLPVPVWRAVSTPGRRSLWLGGIGLMPPALRERLGIRWTERDELAYQRLGRITRAMTPVMPRPLQIMGPTQLRLRRRAIARGPLGPRRPPDEIAHAA